MISYFILTGHNNDDQSCAHTLKKLKIPEILEGIVGEIMQLIAKAWSPYSCNGRKHRRKHVSDSVPSSSDTHEHFDYNIASLTGIVINCLVSSICNDRNNH